MASPTIIDIARAAGVSFKTVARVINREPTVTKKTRERVEDAIARLNYKPNVWARTLRSSRSHMLAMVYTPTEGGDAVSRAISRKDNLSVSHYYNQIHVSAMTVCQDAGYHLLLKEIQPGKRGVEKQIREIVASTQLDGMLFAPPLSDNIAIMKVLRAEKIPFVRISPNKHLELSSYVFMDDRMAAYELTCYLCKLGHRDIAFIMGPPDHLTGQERFFGFEAAMKEHNGNLHPEWLVADAFSMRLGAVAVKKLLSGRRRPTAIVAFNDDIAIGVMSGAYRRGLSLPRDLSIVGFDDAPIASAMWPGLTTVYQPVTAMAKAAAEMLIHQIEFSTDRCVKKLDYEIVLRASAASPNSKSR